MKKVLIHQSNLLTKNTNFILGVLGKPHGLNGYMYLNHDVYFRKYNLTDLEVIINDSEYIIQSFKPHLKDRYLVQFKGFESINDIEKFRNKNVYITSSEITRFMNDDLPWPGFFIKDTLNSKYRIDNYFYADDLIFLTINDDIVIPYNREFFKYEDRTLQLTKFDLIK